MKTAIIILSDKGEEIARKIGSEMEVEVFSVQERKEVVRVEILGEFVGENFSRYSAWIFIGALGIAVRTIAPYLRSKYTDPAVVSIDSTGHYVIPVVSGHVGGANDLACRLARCLGAEAVVTTQSDKAGLWALDIWGEKWGWKTEHIWPMNQLIASFVNGRPTALLLDIQDDATAEMERTAPAHVDVYYRQEAIPEEKYELIIAVTPFIYEFSRPVLYYRPKVLHLGIGCRKNCDPVGVKEYIEGDLKRHCLSAAAIRVVATIGLKKEERLLHDLAEEWGAEIRIYLPEQLQDIELPHPSEKVYEVTGVYGVAESVALKSAENTDLLIEKQRACVTEGNQFTYAVALDKVAERGGFIEIDGAGPGDPELISVRGKQMLERADLILYAGSLVPVELTYYAKAGATVRSSASLTLEEQFALMKEFYDKGLFVVRLHTGDPCIYGAIQEQMAFFDRYGMRYHITPGISSFLAAAAALHSQFTIPEKTQTIILTRGEGRTPMPEKEKLHLLARSQSTMCIFLSASIAEEVQSELMQHYPPETPVAVCYHLTWKDEKIFRGKLEDLAAIIKEKQLTLTTLIVVGEAVGNRSGLSKLYSGHFTHLFRKGKEESC